MDALETVKYHKVGESKDFGFSYSKMNFKPKLPEDQEPISSQLQNDASSQTLENHTAELQMLNLVFQVKLGRKMSPADHRKHSQSVAVRVQEHLQSTAQAIRMREKLPTNH